MDNTTSLLAELADHLVRRRQAVLSAWRAVSMADADQATAGGLTRSQFEDHIPGLLDAWAVKLRPPAPGVGAEVDAAIHEQESKHGLQRWQQGYRLVELLREWGYLHLVLAREIAAFAVTRLEWTAAIQNTASLELLQLINEGIASSAAEYAEMARVEASGKVNDLELALRDLREVERRRTQLIHQVVHDLRGNVQSVTGVANLLTSAETQAHEREEFATLLPGVIDSVSVMLEDLMQLSRLEAGREHLTVAPFDAARVVADLCQLMQPQAKARGLYLKSSGPETLPVEGDGNKVRRTLQNLVINALKYTERGGVTVTWGTEPKHWWMKVEDTGPGLLAGPAAPIAVGLRQATADAREVDVKSAAADGREPTVLDQADAGSTTPTTQKPHHGEGVGLSIIKRLCELLEASLELISSSESGTTFRVVIPLAYPQKTPTQDQP